MSVEAPSQLFVREIEHDGQKLTRPLVFYVGLNKEGKFSTTLLIRRHGGRVVDHPGDSSSNIIPLVDPKSKGKDNCRVAFSVDYVKRCIAENQLLDLEPFRIPIPKRSRRSSAGISKAAEIPKATKTSTDSTATSPIVAKWDPPEPEQITSGTNAQSIKHGNGTSKGLRRSPRTKGKKVSIQVCQPRNLSEALNNTDARVHYTPMKTADYANARSPDKKEPTGSKSVNQGKDNSRLNQSKARPPAKRNRTELAPWSSKEDAELAHIYKCGKEERNVAYTETLRFWTRMENADVLPEGRSAEDCHARFLYLQGNASKKRRRSESRDVQISRDENDGDENDEEANDEEANDEEANDEEANDEEANDEEANDEEANDEEANDEGANGGGTNVGGANNEDENNENVNDENVNDEDVNDKDISYEDVDYDDVKREETNGDLGKASAVRQQSKGKSRRATRDASMHEQSSDSEEADVDSPGAGKVPRWSSKDKITRTEKRNQEDERSSDTEWVPQVNEEERSSDTEWRPKVPLRQPKRKQRGITKVRKKILKVISGLASLAKCSEKRAFRALRDSKGDWRTALSSLRQRNVPH